MKKICSMFLAIIMCILAPAKLVYATSIDGVMMDSQEDDELQEIINELKVYYVNDPMFYMDASSQGYTFDEYLAVVAKRILASRDNAKLYYGDDLDGYGNNGQNYWANVKLIQQPNGYACGPTSALQVLYGMNRQSFVYGSTDIDKITTLSNNSYTNSSTGTVVYNLVNALNLYTPAYGNYGYYQIVYPTVSQSQMQAWIQQSLYYDFGPILHAQTSYLSYYGGHSSGHYIAVYALDLTNNLVGVKDCNYNNSYYGSHYESITNVYNCLQSRYLICYQ